MPMALRKVSERALWDTIYPEHEGHDLRALPTKDTSIRAVCLDCLPDEFRQGGIFEQEGKKFEALVITHVQWMKACNKEMR